MEKKIIGLAIIIICIIIWIIASWKVENDDIDSKAINLARNYITERKMTINNHTYLLMANLINGSSEEVFFRNCNKSSGVLVTNEDNKLSFQPVLKCVDYSSIHNPNNFISLNGDAIVVINQNDEYEDLGYRQSVYSIFTDEQKLTDNVTEIIYYASSGNSIVEEAKRFIIKSDDKTRNIDGSYDPSFPMLSLLGDEEITISYGDTYKDKGCLANDSLDGDITSLIEKKGEVNSFVKGEYEIHYKVTNSRGNYVSTKRKVFVTENDLSNSGSCTATVTRDEVKVTVNGNVKIINYRYYINNNEETSNSNVLKSAFTKDNLPIVKVTINDGSAKNKSLVCKSVGKFNPEMYTDINGYNCLEGYVCYKQKDYSTKYQASSDGPGPLSKNGCLPTSMAIIVSKYDKRSLSGSLLTPETLVNEVIYTQGKVWGYSDYERVGYISKKLNLHVSEKYSIKNHLDIFKKALMDGKQIIANVTDGCYANSGGHYLTVIGINDNNQIFISDPYSKTTSSMHKTCTVNTWSDINEFVNKGAVSYFAVISE